MKRRNFIQSSLAIMPFASPVTDVVTSLKTNERTSKGFVVKAGQSRFNETTKLGNISLNDIKISSKDTDSNLTVFEYTGNEKGGPPLHIHPFQDEIFFIQDGKYLFQVGDEKHNLTVGDIIFLPRNVPHAFAQLTDKGKMLFFFQPSGKMEDFFRLLGTLKGAPSPQEGAKIFEDHDMKIVGPPLSF